MEPRRSQFRWYLKETMVAAMVACLSACTSAPSTSLEPVDLTVRIYVDRNADGQWNDGDIPLPQVTITLDDDIVESSDTNGLIRFSSVSRTEHVLALPSEAVAELSSHSLVCSSTSKTVQISDATEVGFCFVAQGFMNVDVKEEP